MSRAVLKPDDAASSPAEDHVDWAVLGLLVAAATLFYLAPWHVVSLLALAAVVVLAWRRLDLAILLVPLFAPFFYHPWRIGHEQFIPSEILLLVVAAVFVTRLAGERALDPSAIRFSPFLYPAALLLVAATVSTVLAVDRHHALEWYRWTIVEPLVFFALVLLIVPPGRRYRLALALVVGGVAVAVLGLGQYVTHQDLSVVKGSPLQRVQGPYGSPDNLGLLFDRVIPLWFAMVLMLPVGVALWKRAVWWLPAVLLGAALFLTYSRGAWLAIPLGCLLVLTLVYPWGRWLALSVIVVAAGGLVVKGPSVVHTLQTGHSKTVEQRVNIWKSSVDMIRTYPVFGVGPDNFVHYYAPTRQQDRWQSECAPGLGYMQPGAGDEPCLSHPHNEFLDFWLSTGILGLIAFIWLQTVFWRQAILGWLTTRGVLQLGAMGAMLAALIHGLVDNSYFLPDLAILFWVLCALVTRPRSPQSA